MRPDDDRALSVFLSGLIITSLLYRAGKECPGCGVQPMGLPHGGVCDGCYVWLCEHPDDRLKIPAGL